jgi:hypothetical protein
MLQQLASTTDQLGQLGQRAKDEKTKLLPFHVNPCCMLLSILSEVTGTCSAVINAICLLDRCT